MMPKYQITPKTRSNPNYPGSVQTDKVPERLQKKIPGVTKYDRDWLWPKELWNTQEPTYFGQLAIDGLHPYQKEGALRALAHRRFRLDFEMGLGKSVTALAVLRTLGLKNILIVCPSISKHPWEKEFEKWWPRDDIYIHKTGDSEVPAEGVVIVSWHLVHSIPTRVWDGIVLDELHYCANKNTQWWEPTWRHSRGSPDAFVLGLTGTPIPDEVINLWGQLEVLCPGRFGSFWEFAFRYTNVESNAYGKKPRGGKRHDELQQRLDFFSARATRAEWAHLLPKISPPKSIYTSDKLGDLRQLVKDDVLPTVDRCAILCDRRASVEKYAQALKAFKRPVFTITGEDTPIMRHKILEGMPPKAFLVATFHSINTSVDLTTFQAAIWAELYARPAVMLQSIGRFIRLSGTTSTALYFLIEEFTQEASTAVILAEKISQMNQVIKAGAAEESLGGVLDNQEGFDKWIEGMIEQGGSNVEGY